MTQQEKSQQVLDLYSDYLMVTFGQATAKGLSDMLEGDLSHDAVTRFLSAADFTSKDLWQQVKKTVRTLQAEDAVLIFDDTLQEKPHMAESELICWHYDHCSGRNIKGINLLNCLYRVNDISIPVAFELVRKPVQFRDVVTHQEKRASIVTKNEHLRAMLDTCVNNQLPFAWVLADSWYSSSENMKHIKEVLHKDFVFALKSNRLVALSGESKKQQDYLRLDQMQWPEHGAVTAWLKGFSFPVRLVRQIFTNQDGSSGTLYLAASKLEAEGDEITKIYQKRWSIEVFHKSLKSNVALAKSPAHTVRTQANHIFCTFVAVFKMECLKLSTKLNQFALKAKLYLKAIRSAFDELRLIRAA